MSFNENPYRFHHFNMFLEILKRQTNFKKFDWNFNPPNEKENTIDLALDADIDTSALNLFGIKTPGIDCSEGECCGDGTVWDNALYKCKPAQV